MEQKKYLIIAGSNKCGTTSLFDYLVDHPEIEGSSIKQTHFFLDNEVKHQLGFNSIYDYELGLNQFKKFFINPKEETKFKVEATPDYMYSPGTAARILEFFKDNPGKVLVILRNPVSRFNSFFYFGKQQGLIPESMSYLDFFYESKSYTGNTNPCLLAYKTGFYSEYISEYKALFGDDFKVVFFHDLESTPKIFMQNLCNYLNISSDFYNDYEFQIKNKTVQTKNHHIANIYAKARKFYLKNFYETKTGVYTAKFLKKTVTPLYKKVNYKNVERNKEDLAVNKELEKDYQKDVVNLQAIIKRTVRW